MADKSSSSPQPQGSTGDIVAESTARRKPVTNHLLSCTNCRKRKVKCNKLSPCSACERSSLSCVFPNRARLPRGRTGGSKATNNELLRRLSKLEELLENAQKNENNEPTKPATTYSSKGIFGSTPNSESGAADGVASQPVANEVLDKYIGSNFWKSLIHEVDGLRQTLNEVSDDEEESPIPGESESSNSPMAHSAWILGHDLQQTGLRSLHPSPSQILMLCNIYVDNVDPIFKVTHVPTFRRTVLDASNSLDNIVRGKSMEALLFAMYYAAVTSLPPEKCKHFFEEDKETLLQRYRSGTEVALTNADLLTGADMTTLQALVIFLTCVRCHDDSKFSWTLISLAIRIAQSLGLHRENKDSLLHPFTQELRRRLWWQIIVLDVHASEDRGSDPMLNELSFNTRKPLNINDEDLDPENPSPLSEKSGCTDMTFCLLCHETSTISRCFNTLPPSVDDYNSPSNELSIEKKISIVTKLQDHLRKKYLVHCDPGNAIALVLIRLTRMIISRMWLSIYHPFQPERRPYVYPALTRDMLLSTSVEILETAHFLEHEPSTAHWRWYFKSWTQWHALAVVLAELCVKNQGPLVARAWNIIDIVFEPWASTIADSRHGMLWRPIRKLMTKAKANRQGILSMDDLGSTPNTTNSDIVFPQLQPCYSDFPAPDVMSISQEMNSNTEAMLQDMMIHHQISRNQDILPGFAPKVMPAPTSQQTILDFIAQQPTPDFPPQQTLPTFTPSIGATEDAGTINWAEWDEFMQDFEIETGPGESDKSHQEAKSFGNLWLL